ncbi:MAG: 2-oxoacid:acceptor oxidoreductase family protein [Candidatus Thermoplasmatota archaeon]|nr:2-oxoacid:acceptor oxidoreductase family protein [Candidatus Thermoplasmatota archaeon]
MRTEIRMAGFGGQGIITMGKILGRAAVIYDRRPAVLTEDYGPEKIGGWSKADLVLSDEEIQYPLVDRLDIFLALSQDGYEMFHHTLRVDGQALFESDLVNPEKGWKQRTTFIPALQTASDMGKKVVANIVMIGALVELTQVVSVKAAKKAILDSIPKGTEDLNEAAFSKGRELAREEGG